MLPRDLRLMVSPSLLLGYLFGDRKIYTKHMLGIVMSPNKDILIFRLSRHGSFTSPIA